MMIKRLDHLIIAVKDIEEAERNYTKLFGNEPVWRGEHKELGTINSLYNFSNIYLELLATNGKGIGADLVERTLSENGEGLAGLVLGTDDISQIKEHITASGYNSTHMSEGEGGDFESGKIRNWKNLFLPQELTRGMFSFIIQHTEGHLSPPQNVPDSAVNKLDHVVINTNDADGFIKTYKEVYGIRLALDQTVEKWGGRMLFFRLNKTTIEVIAKEDGLSPKDKLWGLAWDVKDIKQTYDRLRKEGFDMTPVIEGRKPNTLVSTVKSNTHNIPTLLIQHIPS
jgi:catechol 2,3-dioxygenase-like lactoylglutathione lyase family enzyme/predicted enzyme related to lactoylglutathione lyase